MTNKNNKHGMKAYSQIRKQNIFVYVIFILQLITWISEDSFQTYSSRDDLK